MIRHIDLLVQDANGQSVAIVEVKNLSNLSREDAIDIWQSWLHEYASIAHAEYTLLLSQDVGFMWQKKAQTATNDEPILEFSMTDVVERYALESQKGKQFRGSSLELLIQQWLINLSWQVEEPTHEPEVSLAKVGFLNAVRDTIVIREAPLYDRVR